MKEKFNHQELTLANKILKELQGNLHYHLIVELIQQTKQEKILRSKVVELLDSKEMQLAIKNGEVAILIMEEENYSPEIISYMLNLGSKEIFSFTKSGNSYYIFYEENNNAIVNLNKSVKKDAKFLKDRKILGFTIKTMLHELKKLKSAFI